jgi:hypothetical protein
MMKRALLLAVCVAGGLSGKPTTAATLPKEFTGVWIAAAETDNECKKQDWKGVAGENDRLINITAKAIEEFESGCTIKIGQNVTRLATGGTNVRGQLELQRRRNDMAQQPNLARSERQQPQNFHGHSASRK